MLAISDTKKIRAVAESICANADLVKHPEVEVAKRGVFRVAPVPGFRNFSACFTEHEDGQVIVIVSVAIGDTATVDDHRAIQQGFAVFLDGFELIC